MLGFPGAHRSRRTRERIRRETALAEFYEVPWNNPKAQGQGFSPRGLDIDRNGVVWTVLASGHLASFDRRKCKGPLNGPKATGQHCPEGWTLYPSPGPKFQGGEESGSAESHYYDWVDQFDTFGLGKNVPIATGNGSDSLLALVNGKFVILRVPYPIGFFAKGMDGRIDDPHAGWKGKGLVVDLATRTPFHSESGKGTSRRWCTSSSGPIRWHDNIHIQKAICNCRFRCVRAGPKRRLRPDVPGRIRQPVFGRARSSRSIETTARQERQLHRKHRAAQAGQ